MHKHTYVQLQQCSTGGPCVQESIDLAAYLRTCISVLLTTALTKIDVDGCSLDRRPFRDLLRK